MTTQEQRAAVVAEAHTWIGTKFHDNARVKGVGVDCAMILVEVFARVGFVIPPIPRYRAQWHVNQSEPIFIDTLLKAGCRELIDEVPQPGDIAMFHFGRCYAHSGIVVKWPTIIHALFRSSVVLTDASRDGHLLREQQRWPVRFFSPWPIEVA